MRKSELFRSYEFWANGLVEGLDKYYQGSQCVVSSGLLIFVESTLLQYLNTLLYLEELENEITCIFEINGFSVSSVVY